MTACGSSRPEAAGRLPTHSRTFGTGFPLPESRHSAAVAAALAERSVEAEVSMSQMCIENRLLPHLTFATANAVSRARLS